MSHQIIFSLGASGLTPYAPSPATVASYSPSSSPTRTQSAQGSPTNSHKPWRPRARSADESTRKIVSILSLYPNAWLMMDYISRVSLRHYLKSLFLKMVSLLLHLNHMNR